MIFSPKNKQPSWISQYTPAIKNRFFHIDLKGPKIPLDVFLSLLEQIARWGINGVVVEYEHRLPYLPLPHQFPIYERYMESEIKMLLEKAQSLEIEWIPLVQTFGHVEYLSRLQGTEKLFENPDYPSQLCPSKKIVRQYIQDLIDYICTLHPESKYIHIGLDETRQLGFCPECSKKVKKLGDKMGLYFEHAQFVWEEVLKHNKTPMLWADMFLGNGRLDLVSRIDKKVILVPWDYTSIGKTSNRVIYKGHRAIKKQFYNNYNQPETLASFTRKGNFFEDLDSKEKGLIGFDRATGYPFSFPHLRLLSHTKQPLWAACGLYMSADMQFHANFVRGVLNPAGMCDFIVSNKGEGIIGTLWARGHSFAPINAPWTTVLYNLVHFARASYTGKTSPSDFKRYAKEIAYELDMPEIFDRTWSLDDICWIASSQSLNKIATLENLLEIFEKHKVSGCFGDGLRLCLKAEYLQAKIRSVIDEGRWWYSTREQMPDVLMKGMKNRLSYSLKEVKDLKKSLKDYYLRWVGDKKSFAMWWENLFTLDSILAKDVIKRFR